ncbi:class I SAM-dependent methyltransferase [Propionibacteriaceae bacterium Y1923]
MTPDPYAAPAGAYDLFNAPARAGQVAALDALLPHLDPSHGPILDVGAGSGLNIAHLLEHSPAVSVYALEPSPTMRALALARVAARPDWFDRVTVRPEDFFSATLPPRLGEAVLLGVIGHFDAGERAAVLAELAARLPTGGAALFDLQPPERPEGDSMTSTEVKAEHTTGEHEHGTDCGHEAVEHGDHVDYVHDGHKHAAHADHYDEH